MLAGAAAALHTVAGARTPTVASDSAAAASAAGRFDGQHPQTLFFICMSARFLVICTICTRRDILAYELNDPACIGPQEQRHM